MTIAAIKNEALREYAARLLDAGFTVYVPNGTWGFIRYSRVVDGTMYGGSVQREDFSGCWTHHMPIKPSTLNGSSMWVEDMQERPTLEVEDARLICRKANWNKVVGRQNNYVPSDWRRGYTVVPPSRGLADLTLAE